MSTEQQNFLATLVSHGLIEQRDSRDLADRYRDNSESLLQHLVEMSPRNRDRIGHFWGSQMNKAYVDPMNTRIHYELVHHLPEDFARSRRVLPLYEFGGAITLATPTPQDEGLRSQVETLLDTFVSPVFAFPDQVDAALEIAYQSDSRLITLLSECVAKVDATGRHLSKSDISRLSADDAVISFTCSLILMAVKRQASDIHIEPSIKQVRVRFRIDGVLQRVLVMEKSLLLPVASRLKVMADLDISETRHPLDGRIEMDIGARHLALRVSTMPTVYGEKIVLRLLGQSNFADVPNLSELGFSKSLLAKLKRVASSQNGIFFVTGPTGSGKSTTLYAILKFLNNPGINIVTAENPVEYPLEGVNQVQINDSIGLTFAEALRCFLRQDPDVILVGEIRDLETARIATRAALTGHLVLTTMHTNSAFQSISRLLDFGLDPSLLAPCLVGVMAQRLVRRLCRHCKQLHVLSSAEMDRLFEWEGEAPVSVFRAVGCPVCGHIGYRGRVAIQECFLVDPGLSNLIAGKKDYETMCQYGLDHDFTTLQHDAMKKVLQGLTTIEEVERVIEME